MTTSDEPDLVPFPWQQDPLIALTGLPEAEPGSFITDIVYIFAVLRGKPWQATPLAGFAPDLCASARIVRHLAGMPAHIYEPCPEYREGRLAARVSGQGAIQVHGQSPAAIKTIPPPWQIPFTVLVLGLDDSPKEYLDWLGSGPVRPILVCREGGDLTYEQLNLGNLKRELLARCESLRPLASKASVESAIEAISCWADVEGTDPGYKLGGHATVAPNIAAMEAAGFSNPIEGHFRPSALGLQPYVDQIVQTTRSILQFRNDLPLALPVTTFPKTPALNLYAPAMYPEATRVTPPAGLDAGERSKFRIAMNLLKRQKGYSYQITTDRQNQSMSGLTQEELESRVKPLNPHPLVVIRQQELWLSTAALEVLAASEISAVIRWPNDVNRTASAVRHFSDLYRGSRSPRQRRDDFRAIQKRLAEATPPEFMDLLREGGPDLRILANAHLEWLDLDGIPLGLRKNVSRIPVTPGNLFIGQTAAAPTLRLFPDDCREILVLSALHPADQIRQMFEVAFDAFSVHWRDQLRINVVEIDSEGALIRALNDYDGSIAIFDGHGSHKPGEPGVISLQGTDCDVWTLRDKLKRVPPIMVLSACDTHAADRNHATVANGFLALGCRAVLGSVFPLEATEAAIFAARLLYRIAAYVPGAVNGYGRALTWGEICSGMLRMQAVTGFRHDLERKRLITREQMLELGNASNVAINMEPGDPFERILNKAVELGVDPKQAKRQLETSIAGSSAISYLHLGRPETILFDTPQRAQNAKQELRAAEPA